jgi:hypothetical protein
MMRLKKIELLDLGILRVTLRLCPQTATGLLLDILDISGFQEHGVSVEG